MAFQSDYVPLPITPPPTLYPPLTSTHLRHHPKDREGWVVNGMGGGLTHFDTPF